MQTHRISRNSTIWLAIVAVLGLVCLPPEHVHATDDHGGHEEVLHRHIAPHHEPEPDATFDHQDGDTRYLTSAFAIPDSRTRTCAGQADVVATLPPAALPLESALNWTLLSLRIVRVHDPPWTASLALRAPPAFADLV